MNSVGHHIILTNVEKDEAARFWKLKGFRALFVDIAAKTYVRITHSTDLPPGPGILVMNSNWAEGKGKAICHDYFATLDVDTVCIWVHIGGWDSAKIPCDQVGQWWKSRQTTAPYDAIANLTPLPYSLNAHQPSYWDGIIKALADHCPDENGSLEYDVTLFADACDRARSYYKFADMVTPLEGLVQIVFPVYLNLKAIAKTRGASAPEQQYWNEVEPELAKTLGGVDLAKWEGPSGILARLANELKLGDAALPDSVHNVVGTCEAALGLLCALRDAVAYDETFGDRADELVAFAELYRIAQQYNTI
jgi:hypothetical protein